MALDPNLPLQALNPRYVTPIDTPFESAGKATVLAERQQQLADLREQAQSRAALRQALQQSGGDLEKAIPAVMQSNPVLGLKMRESLQHFQTMNLQAEKAKLDHDEAIAGYMGRVLGGATNQDEWDLGLAAAKHAGFDVSQEPAAFDPARAAYHHRVAMTVSEQIRDAREKSQEEQIRLADERARTEEERKQAADAAKEKENQIKDAAAAAREKRMADIQAGQLAVSKGNLAVAQHREQRETQQAAAQAPVDIKEDSKEYRQAQDLAYGKLTLADFQRLYGRGAQNSGLKTSIYDKAHEINPNFNPTAFEMGFKLASNPKVQQQLASLDNVTKGVPDLLRISDEASRTNIPILNAAILKGGARIGGKQYSNLQTARTAFADELSGALGYGSATDMSRDMGFQMTDPTLSPAAFKSAIQDVVIPFVARKKQTLLDQMGVYGQPGMNPAATSGVEQWERGPDGKLRKVTK